MFLLQAFLIEIEGKSWLKQHQRPVECSDTRSFFLFLVEILLVNGLVIELNVWSRDILSHVCADGRETSGFDTSKGPETPV